MNKILEIKRTLKDNITPNSHVTFNVASPYSNGIVYDPVAGEIVLAEPGQYTINWWIATETSLTGCIQFALKSSQRDEIIGCSPTKRGQVVGFGEINARTANVRLSLVNTGSCQVIMSKTSPVKAALSVMRIPEEGVTPTFAVKDTTTLGPGQNAAVTVEEDIADPDNWLFSFGIPKGTTGATGTSPHIDPTSGNWFISNTDTGVKAQGPTGPIGPASNSGIIPFCVKEHSGISFNEQGDPEAIAFLGFGGSYSMPLYLKQDEWATKTITIGDDDTFVNAFVMPYDAIIQNINVLFSLEHYGDSELEGKVQPFVCLAVADTTNGIVYTILTDSITFTAPFESGQIYPAHTTRRGVKDNLNIKVSAGTLIGIVAGVMGDASADSYSIELSISGGICFQ